MVLAKGPDHMKRINTIAALALASLGTLMSGCIGGNSKSKMTGDYVGATTVGKIEPGVTTSDRVLAMLGQPTRRSTLDDGSQLWVWSWKRTSSGGGYVFPIAFGSSRSETEGSAFVEIKDGLVVDAWRD